MPNEEPIKVLCIAGGALGGVETWMLDVLRSIDRDRFDVDVMAVPRGCVDDYRERVRSLGSRLIHCPFPSDLRALGFPGFARAFRGALAEFGPYDVVHDCVNASALTITMGLARRAGVPVRIVHIRVAHGAEVPGEASYSRKLKHAVRMALFPRSSILRDVTHLLGVSSMAVASLFGENVLSDRRYLLAPSFIDISPFDPQTAVKPVREALGLGANTAVLGHVGRFEDVKNHGLWVRIAAELSSRRQDIAFILVGDGTLRSQIEDQVRRAGLAEQFRFVGFRSDVADIMRGSMNALLFPSKSEGMGRVVVEAQAAGLPCVISDVIPREVDIVPDLIHRRSLSDDPAVWAEAVLDVLDRHPPVQQREAFGLVAASPFSVGSGIRALEEVYAAARTPRRPEA